MHGHMAYFLQKHGLQGRRPFERRSPCCSMFVSRRVSVFGETWTFMGSYISVYKQDKSGRISIGIRTLKDL